MLDASVASAYTLRDIESDLIGGMCSRRISQGSAMFDLKWIRDNADAFDAAMAKRGLAPQAAGILELDQARRDHIAELQDAQNRRNDASKQIGAAKASGDEAKAQALIDEVAGLKAFVQDGEEKERELTEEARPSAFRTAEPAA